jgi:hypothetical protein
MTEKQKISLKEKEEKLRKKIEEAKNALSRLQEKRQIEIGKLACKHGLDTIDNTVLDKHFSKLAKALVDGNT